tara:strand:+ start:87184 stop:87294 length:111 start_codon:yes stop_codon:yes gene_type:complete
MFGFTFEDSMGIETNFEGHTDALAQGAKRLVFDAIA